MHLLLSFFQKNNAVPISSRDPFLPVRLRYGDPFLPPRGRLLGARPTLSIIG